MGLNLFGIWEAKVAYPNALLKSKHVASDMNIEGACLMAVCQMGCKFPIWVTSHR